MFTFFIKNPLAKKNLAYYNKSCRKTDNRIWERSSVWLERMPVTHEVASSSLVVPAIFRISTFGCFFSAI